MFFRINYARLVRASSYRMRAALVLKILVTVCMMASAQADPIRLYAAGSLKEALTTVATAFEGASGNKVEAKYGPSGLLKNEILEGANADLFASANMEHPQDLRQKNVSSPVLRFARNSLCALVRPGLAVDPGNLLDRLLDPNVKVGISTPKADPSGDYAIEVFRKAELLKPGAQAALEKKSFQLTGGPNSAKPPAGRTVYGWHVAEGRADIFLTYCTNALLATKENSTQRIVALPDAVSVGADYGLTVMNGAPPSAQRLADFIMSPKGQEILAKHGFETSK